MDRNSIRRAYSILSRAVSTPTIRIVAIGVLTLAGAPIPHSRDEAAFFLSRI